MACIYQIRNLENNKIYIGSTSHLLKKRKGEHLIKLRANYHGNRHLQSSFNKYGENSFIFETIEEVEFPSYLTFDQKYKYLTDKELYYINTLLPDYNICKETRGGKLGRKLSKEQIEQIRIRNTGRVLSEKTIEKIKLARAKQIITEEHKKNISKGLIGIPHKKGHKQSLDQKLKASKKAKELIVLGVGFHSPESKEKRTLTLKRVFNTPEMKTKLSSSAKNRYKKSFVCIKDNIIIKQFNNQIDAAKEMNLRASGISAVLTGIQKTYKGYTFKYK